MVKFDAYILEASIKFAVSKLGAAKACWECSTNGKEIHVVVTIPICRYIRTKM